MKKILALLCFFSLAVANGLFYWVYQADAASTTINTTAQFTAGVFTGTESSSRSAELRLQASGSWTARVWKTPHIALGDQARAQVIVS